MPENDVNAVPETVPEKPKDVAIVRERTAVQHFDANDPASLFMQTNVFDQLQRVAVLMAKSSLVPKHLQEQVSDCFLVASQAMQWKMNPFAVAQSCYVLQGKVGYEGKLIAAVVNASPALKTKLNYEYSGSGVKRQVRVFGTLKGEDKPREVIGTVEAWQTVNKQWSTQTDQMLSYRGAREWARRHMPEAILGIYADEEIEVINATATVVTEPSSLDDFTGEVVSAKDDPKVVDAVKVEPKKEAKKATPKPTPTQEPAPMDADDQAIAALFDKP